MLVSAGRGRYSVNIWPGFVDALASVLIVFIFMLLVFVVAQFSLSDLLADRDSALARLTRQIDELAKTLSLERADSAELQTQLAELDAQLSASLLEQQSLSEQLRLALAERDAALQGGAASERELADALATVRAQQGELELKLAELASLQADIAALREVRRALESKVAELELSLQTGAQTQALLERTRAELEHARVELERARAEAERRGVELERRGVELERQSAELGAVRDRSKALVAQLADARERTRLAQVELEQRELRLQELLQRIRAADAEIVSERDARQSRDARIETLNASLRVLRKQLLALSAALELSEAEVREKKIEVANLGRRLNLALARKVAELGRYRSEFFGRLREVLGERSDIEIVGDRFLFQSELLFESGSAELGPAGQQQLLKLAATLTEIATDIPADIDWVLQVDGHTDIRPIRTARFPSNWELSVARALSIVKFLTRAGVPEARLAAAGFGEFQPRDEGRSEEAFRRNRRIEIKLTQP